MRYVEVTHVYILPIDGEDVEAVDAIANAGASIMEDFMTKRAPKIRNLRSDWKLLPREYVPEHVPGTNILDGRPWGSGDPGDEQPDEITVTPAKKLTKADLGEIADRNADREQSKYMIENDLDQGISLAGDVFGQSAAKVTHPWDQGLRVFPLDGSEMSVAETQALFDENMICGDSHEGEVPFGCHLVRGHSGPHAADRAYVAMRRKEVTDGTD